MDYKKVSNELLFVYHKNIDFVYKVLGEFLYNTDNFKKRFSKIYKTTEGKVSISWDKYNDWSISLNESASKIDNKFKLSITEDIEDDAAFNSKGLNGKNNQKRILLDVLNDTLTKVKSANYVGKDIYSEFYNSIINNSTDTDLTILLLDETDYCQASKFSANTTLNRLKNVIAKY